MSTDRTAEMLNYLSAISREIGEFRKEVNERFAQVNERFVEVSGRLDRIERQLRQQGQRLDRIEGLSLTNRADIEQLQDRVDALEEKSA